MELILKIIEDRVKQAKEKFGDRPEIGEHACWVALTKDQVDYLIQSLRFSVKSLETAGGQLGAPDIGDACANACKTISHALHELKGDKLWQKQK